MFKKLFRTILLIVTLLALTAVASAAEPSKKLFDESNVAIITAAPKDFTQQELDRFLASKPAQLLPQVKAGTVAGVIGPSQVASVSPPTALSLTWGMDGYVDALIKAVAAVKR